MCTRTVEPKSRETVGLSQKIVRGMIVDGGPCCYELAAYRHGAGSGAERESRLDRKPPVRSMQELSTRERRPVLPRGPVGCKKRTGWGFRAALGFASIVGLAGCSTTILSPIGPVADGERTILLDSLAIMLAIVVPTIIAVLMVAWWFRASNDKAVYRPTWSYSGRLELIVWSIPALIVMFLGGIAWISSHELDPKQPMKSQVRPIDVDVVALDWKWLFIYPAQNLASVNRIVVPVGAPLRLHITSASVLNVFFVPRLGSEIYAMSGMTNELNLLASQPGRLSRFVRAF